MIHSSYLELKLPNILITGTPGTGKTTLAIEVVKRMNEMLSTQYGPDCPLMEHVDIAKMINERRLYNEVDDAMEATIFDDKLVQKMLMDMQILKRGGYVLDFHDVYTCADFVDQAFLLYTDTYVLYDRLSTRKYTSAKIRENIECLIFNVIEEDLEDYPSLYETENKLSNNDMDQFEKNVLFICQWIKDHIYTHAVLKENGKEKII